MRKILVLAVMFVQSLSFSALAGEQKVLEVKNARIEKAEPGKKQILLVSGDVQIKDRSVFKKGGISHIGFTGTIVGEHEPFKCNPFFCSLNEIYFDDGLVLGTLEVDTNRDGKNDFGAEVEMGRVTENGEVVLNNVTVSFVQTRYSILEKLTGAKDSDYFAVSIHLEE